MIGTITEKTQENPVLAACPFCGGEAEVVEDFYDCPRYWVRCKTCAGTAYGPDENDDKHKAIIAWNRRYVCLDKNGKKVYAGDEVKTAFRGMISLEPVMTIMFGGRPNRRMCFSSDIELIEESEAPND